MTTRGHQQLMMTASTPSSLTEAIAALSPSFYWRHAEASGSVMNNEVSVVEGAYVGAPLLAQTPLYPGGPTCAYFGSSKRGEDTAALPATVTSLSLFSIVKFTTLSGMRGLISRDPGTNRKWQWRTNGTSIQFVRVAGTISTVSTPTGVIGTTKAHVLGLTVNGTTVKFFVDGVQVHSATLASVENLGGASKFEIGYTTGGGSSLTAEAYFSESSYFPTELLGSDMAALYAASGL